MNDLTMTNVWLAILAVVSLVEFFMIVVAGLLAYRLYRQAMLTIETIERVHVAPLRIRVDALLDEVQQITGRVKQAQNSMSHVLHTAAGAGSLIAGTVRARSWPLWGVLNGVRVAAATLLRNGKDYRHVPST
jgi:hypothetical protein